VKLIKNPLIWIFVLALFLRICKLGEFPFGFHVDEVKVGWNAISILETGRDDHNKSFSLYYNSFGDFRPTGIFYFTIPSVAIFGRTEFATRFPTALIGSLTILPLYFLGNIFFKKKRFGKKWIKSGFVASFLLAISPWHIELSRSTNEVVISSFFAIFAIYFFIELINSKKAIFSFLTIGSIIISYLTYHSIRFLGPFFFIVTFLYYFKKIKSIHAKKIVWFSVLSICALTIFFSLTREGLARFDQVSIFKDVDVKYQIQRIQNENNTNNLFTYIFDNNLVIYSQRFIQEYSNYFSPAFLIGATAKPYRFSTPGTSLLTYIEFVLLVTGIIKIFRKETSVLPLIILLLAPLPAAITVEDAPNMSRAFLMLPFIILIESEGLIVITDYSRKFKKLIIILVLSLVVLNSSYFLHMYFNHAVSHRPFLKDYSNDSPTYRDVGTKELVLKLDSLKNKYDKVIITNFPDSPYPWYAFFTNKNPSVINKSYSTKTNEKEYDNIVFSEKKCPSETALTDYLRKNILIIDSWECHFRSDIFNNYPLKIVGNIFRPDGTEVYALLERDWDKPLVINNVVY
jgi:4-amino-4-deoxy-L-arabinose transferase-like glycosyltransferase